MLDTLTKQKNALQNAIWAGYSLLLIVPLSFAVMFFGDPYALNGVGYMQLLSALLSLLTAVAYVMLLVGVEAVAINMGSDAFRRAVRHYTVLTILTTPIIVAGSFVESYDWVTGLYTIVLLLVLVLAGVFSIRVARSLSEPCKVYGGEFIRARRWLYISGWLMATGILSLFGAFASLIADYHLWRIVQKQLVRTSGSAYTATPSQATPAP